MKQIILTQKAPQPIGAYSQAVLSGKTLYISGQIAVDPKTKNLVLDSIEAETKQIMENLKEILLDTGMTFKNVVKTSIFILDMNNFAVVNKVYEQYFDRNFAPARETVAVVGLPKNVNVEISVIATK
ncbi:MAG: Rid family detoxifying hydrolase [Tenacibaculum sp.]